MGARPIRIFGAPVEEGAGRRGCSMGPGAYRAAGLPEALAALGHRAEWAGMLAAGTLQAIEHPNRAVKHLPEIVAWTEALAEAAYGASGEAVPIFAGGDHSISAGTLAGIARRAAEQDRPLFVLWLDAHPDFHTLESTQSGNLHGVPLAYATGQPGFSGYFPPLASPVRLENICMMGLRSVDSAEARALGAGGVTIHDMRSIDEHGIGRPLRDFLARAEAANGLLHVSLDVDFLDPTIAPGVGTTVPGGATFREAHLVMELVHDSGLISSLDLVELNPFLDERGRTALLMVDLAASLFGKRVMDRPTKSY